MNMNVGRLHGLDRSYDRRRHRNRNDALTTAWIDRVDRISPDIPIQINAASLPDTVSIQPTPSRRIIGAGGGEVEASGRVVEQSSVAVVGVGAAP